MPLSPEDVERQTFKEKFKGYDMDEVDAFLDRVVTRLAELEAESEELRKQVRAATTSAGESEQLIQRTLVTAQRTADQTVEEAQREADQLLASARDEAERVIAEARDEAFMAAERLQQEAAQLAHTVAELGRFRERYVAAVRGVIEEQLYSLERESVLPEIPEEIDDLVRSLDRDERPVPEAASASERTDAHAQDAVGRSALDTEDDSHADARAGD